MGTLKTSTQLNPSPMFQVVVGHSNDPDAVAAVDEILAQCTTALQGEIPQAGILFAAPDLDHAIVLEQICQTFPGIQLIGGTSDGEISSLLEFQQDSATLMLFCSDEVEFIGAVGRQVSQDPITIARQTVELAKAKATLPPRLCLTLPESLTTSGVTILEGLKQGLGQEVPVVGGTTGDQWKFQGTRQFFGSEVLSDSVPILLLSGNLQFSYGVSSGWNPVGKKGTVTKVEGNVLYEVDNRSILELYQSYLGEMRPSPEYRLAVYEPEGTHWYMRASNGHYDQASGSISFFADIPEQSTVQVVHASRDELVDAAQLSAQQALERYPGKSPAAVLMFSCTGRLCLLGTRTKEEYERVRNSLNQTLLLDGQIPCCGFYTYGEIAPLKLQGESHFHNETFVTLLLGCK